MIMLRFNFIFCNLDIDSDQKHKKEYVNKKSTKALLDLHKS